MTTLTPNRDTEVTVVEQGKLTIDTVTVTYAGTGFKGRILTVPAGKIWVIKSLNIYQTGTATTDYCTIRLGDGTNTINIIYEAPIAAATNYILTHPHELTLPAGFTVEFLFYVSADTDGANITSVLYTEMDA